MEPQRKQGICLTSSPIVDQFDYQRSFRNRTKSGGAIKPTPQEATASSSTASLPRDNLQLAHVDRQPCEFVTFKGRKGNSNNSVAQVDLNTNPSGMLDGNQRQGNGVRALGKGNIQHHGEKPKNANRFQIVPLDYESNPKIPPVIEPITLSIDNKGGDHDSDPTGGSKKGAKGVSLPPPFPFAGFIGTIGSAFFFSLSVFFVKLLPVENTLAEKTKTSMFRGISLMILCSITILYRKSTFIILRGEYLVNFIRSFVGFFGSYGIYVAVQFITVGEATALMYSSPAWTCLFGYLILREPLPITLILGFPLGCIGLILIAHPDLIMNVQDEVVTEIHKHHQHILPSSDYVQHHNMSLLNYTVAGAISALNETELELLSDELPPDVTTELFVKQRLPGMVVGIATSLVVSVVYIALKFRKTTPIETATFYLGVATVIMSNIIQCITGYGKWPTTVLEWGLHFLIGFCSYFGQQLFQWSLMYESAGTLSVVRSIDIVFSFIYSWLFLDEDVLWTSLLGASAIILMIALIMLNEPITRCVTSPFKGAKR